MIYIFYVYKKCYISFVFKSKCFFIVKLSSINLSTTVANSTISLDYFKHSSLSNLFSSVNAESNGDILTESSNRFVSSNLYCFIYANFAYAVIGAFYYPR